MNLFQVLALAALFLALGMTTLALRRHRLSPAAGLLWALLWLASAVFVVYPDLTVGVAHRLGISRGADLVFYCAILAGMAAFLGVYVRLRRIEQQITRLVRILALTGEASESVPSVDDDR